MSVLGVGVDDRHPAGRLLLFAAAMAVLLIFVWSLFD